MTAFKYDYVIDRSLENYASNKILKRVRSGDRVLEVGCATGYLSRILKDEFGCYVVGVELDAEAAQMARRFCDRVLVGDVEALDLANVLGENRFDTIIFADVLEHLNDPVAVLRTCKQLLDKSGRMLISLPNAGYQGVVLEIMEGRFRRRPLGLMDQSHRRFLAWRDALQMVAEAELVPVFMDKTVKGLEDSEFAPAVLPSLPEEILWWVDESTESETYQFILEVMKPTAESLRASSDLLACLMHDLRIESRRRVRERKNFKKVIEAKNRLLAERDEVIEAKNRLLAERDEVIGNKNDMIRFRDQVIQNKNRQIEEHRALLHETKARLNEETALRRKMQMIAKTSPVYPLYWLYKRLRGGILR